LLLNMLRIIIDVTLNDLVVKIDYFYYLYK